MRVTHVRFRRLISGPGYENRAAEIEAAIEDGEDWRDAFANVVTEVNEQLRVTGETAEMRRFRNELAAECLKLERRREALESQVQTNKNVISNHAGLLKIARENDIALDGIELDTQIPF